MKVKIREYYDAVVMYERTLDIPDGVKWEDREPWEWEKYEESSTELVDEIIEGPIDIQRQTEDGEWVQLSARVDREWGEW